VNEPAWNALREWRRSRLISKWRSLAHVSAPGAVQALLDSGLKLIKDTTWAGMVMMIVSGLTFDASCTMVVVPALSATLSRFFPSAQAARPSL
jgi:hypothetical protein